MPISASGPGQSRDPVSRLLGLDTCAISDALDQLALAPAVSGIVPRTTSTRIAGRVITVKLEAGKPPRDSGPHLCTHAIEAAQRGDVIVVEQLTGIDAAGWGGVLSNAAKFRALAGVIVEGPARDLDEAAAIGFPVFSRSATARTARGRVHEAGTAVPVQVGGMTVSSGDYVIADASGVAFIAAASIDAVLAAAESIAAREARMTQAVLDGAPVRSVMNASYEDMLKRS
jgi:4-hydroxy-4-methyl-2-oxoglutarate aldolase